MLYELYFRHVISKIDPEVAHDRVMQAMEFAAKVPGALRIANIVFGKGVGTYHGPWVANVGKLSCFERPLHGRFGVAAGLDKEAQGVETLAALGFSFVEIGTITPRPQPGNDKPRLWRLLDQAGIRNRMGFNNPGAEEAARRLKKLRSTKRGRRVVVGANIGKNKTTPLENAVDDYTAAASALARWVDYIVVNVSSPNTPGLRSLQDTSTLRPILEQVRTVSKEAAGRDIPLFVKIAPDLHDEDIADIARMVADMELDGVVATNTTIDHHEGEGGVSGRPLKEKSLRVVEQLKRLLPSETVIIGCGGVENLEDAARLRAAGADLVQAFTGFIYHGPTWPASINAHLD